MRLNTPKYSEQEPAEGVVGEELEEKAEVGEAVEEVTTSVDGKDEAVEVDTRDVNTKVGEEGEASPEAHGEVLDGSVDMASHDVGEEVVEVKSGEGSELAAVSVPPANGEVKSHESLKVAPPVEENATTGDEPEIESSTSEEVHPQMLAFETEEQGPLQLHYYLPGRSDLRFWMGIFFFFLLQPEVVVGRRLPWPTKGP